ncbi:DUF3618 domain-containing protein [Kibdelosporangium phytohabitans]|uniref:DUF3618 domain-containing protein n=1 Tax=Kibdelosporangium phytohabitans TaxID=860235 RepID=A0A0N9I5X5_9PSEU|nr:DUF3618 domain-containing protein [Kibdelosporangium phytohabitans]ALG11340.1 hypothetical protein AOZ06_34695 [Kibdelosporangium phytohabitans]MBE1462652.1 hypothetical protein [Kibdelosporangium phytohabitans]
MSTHQDLQHEVEKTRRELSETVDELVNRMDISQRVRPLVQAVKDYRLPIALFALSLALTLWGRRK